MENTTTTHPDLHSAHPAMSTEKKPGIADKVKGLLGGHKHAADAHKQHPSVYGDATPATGTAESTRVGCLDKLKAKTGVGHGLAPAQKRAEGGGLMGAHQDPSASPDFNGATNVNSSAAVHGGWPHPTNPNEGVHHNRETHNHPTGLPNPFSERANPNEDAYHNRETHNHPTGLPNPFADAQHYRETQNQATGYPSAGYGEAPAGVTNPHGGAVLGDHQGNIYEGPRDDNEKKEGFVSNVMDKLHSPKGKTANANIAY
jgi:hypothetical protein